MRKKINCSLENLTRDEKNYAKALDVWDWDVNSSSCRGKEPAKFWDIVEPLELEEVGSFKRASGSSSALLCFLSVDTLYLSTQIVCTF